MSALKFSIITVSFNHAEFLRQNIESVLDQKYPNFEHIIVDGGSRDGTVDILRSYPHLIWSSEPDKGQSEALNKGFRRATGDVIGWLNSDDWYAEGAFEEVAKHLQTAPILLGAGTITDRLGEPTKVVKNIERSWFDILKFWIFHSSFIQPAVFFRMDALLEVALSEGHFVDESLNICMDHDLWLRMAMRFGFKNRTEKMLSYFRSYDESKTGSGTGEGYREASRVYRRHVSTRIGSERSLSFVIGAEAVTQDLVSSIESIASQDFSDMEAVIVSTCDSAESFRKIRSEVSQIDAKLSRVNLRVVRSNGVDDASIINTGINSACAPYVAFLEPGDRVPSSFLRSTLELMDHPVVGLAIPFKNRSESIGAFVLEDERSRRFNAESIFTTRYIPKRFVVQKVAFLELQSLKCVGGTLFGVRELLCRLGYRGWEINVNNTLEIIEGKSSEPEGLAHFGVLLPYVTAKLLSDLGDEERSDSFAVVRKEHGFGFFPPLESIERARELLRTAPADWHTIRFTDGGENIERVIEGYPNFFPALLLCAKSYQGRGDEKRAGEMLQRYKEVVAELQGRGLI